MSKLFTAHEVKQHNSRKSVWIVIRNDVYDCTAFLNEHPGGEDPLLDGAGQDATIAFDDVGHSAAAKSMLAKYKIGSLAPGQGCCKMKAKIWRSSSQYHRDCTECDASSRKSSERSSYKAPPSPRAERRIQKIVVPRERRRPACRPDSSSWLKYALLILGVALLVGIVYKKTSK